MIDAINTFKLLQFVAIRYCFPINALSNEKEGGRMNPSHLLLHAERVVLAEKCAVALFHNRGERRWDDPVVHRYGF
jgi:hypothetical protein